MAKAKFDEAATALLDRLKAPLGAAHVRQSLHEGERVLIVEHAPGALLADLPGTCRGYRVFYRKRKVPKISDRD
ncbi:MAG TPA: hypothetical protein VF704_12885 [Allosphingosinicella sp.]|jgi:hypothetical protein